MQSFNWSVPSIINSQTISQSEIQKAMQNMNSTANQSMVLGANLTSITNVSSQGNMTNSVPSLNSSTSVGSEELQNAKNKVQNSGSSKGMF